MKKRTILEDLNIALQQDPNDPVTQQAQTMGLQYVGFGRYHDPKTNQVSHIHQNGNLVPMKRAVKTSTYKQNSTDDFGTFLNASNPSVQELSNVLSQVYNPSVYDEDEINAISMFVNKSYADVNQFLSQLPAGVPTKEIEPVGPDDKLPDLISTLDSAMKKSRVPGDFIVYTKLDNSIDSLSLTPGMEFRFKGYRNTTINLAAIITPDESSSTILQINIKKNSRGIYASNYSDNPDECEFILPRGSKITIVSGPTQLIGSDVQLGTNRELFYYDCILKT